MKDVEIVEDAKRFRWLCSGKKTTSMSLVEYELHIISGGEHSLEKYRDAVDDAISKEVTGETK